MPTYKFSLLGALRLALYQHFCLICRQPLYSFMSRSRNLLTIRHNYMAAKNLELLINPPYCLSILNILPFWSSIIIRAYTGNVLYAHIISWFDAFI